MAGTPEKQSQGLGMMLLSNMLERFVQKGTLRVIDSEGRMSEFSGSPEPVATIRLHDPRLPLKLFRNPELHAGEAYMNGTLTFEECSLEDFLGLFSINRATIASYPLQKVLRRVSKLIRAFQQHNPVGRPQRNVAHHYDLSTEMYRLFLGDDLQYSCASSSVSSGFSKYAQEYCRSSSRNNRYISADRS